LTLQGSIQGNSVGMLLDSGATANLMHPALASKLDIKLKQMPTPLTVVLADGSKRECNQIARMLDLRIKDATSSTVVDTRLQFFVADMPGSQNDIILGMPFLEKENPTIDWLRRSVQLRPADHCTTIHASTAAVQQEPVREPTPALHSAIRRAARTAGAVIAIVRVTVDEDGARVSDPPPPP